MKRNKMNNLQYFGKYDKSQNYKDRKAVYAIILNENNKIAVVKSGEYYWLPGGGSIENETVDETIIREVKEELGRNIRVMNKIGEAIQYFYADKEGCYYKMNAIFIRAEFTTEYSTIKEHNLYWVSAIDIKDIFYHQCHVWAINQVIPL
jgi:8-oxo-dGTP diphosphatase